MTGKLREPKGHFQTVIRRLTETAMGITHFDIDFSEPEATHEMQALERAFAAILRGKLKEPGQ